MPRALRTPPAPELAVKVWRTLGTGQADKSPQSINPPDGLAFTADGLLLATDGENHRVQVFDPVSGVHLGFFGGPQVFRGEVVGIAVAPDGSVAVNDSTNNQAHVYARNDRNRPAFVAAGRPILGDQGFQRLTALAYDSRGRLLAVDGLAGEVRRFLPGLVADRDWFFPRRGPDGRPMLRRPEGIAVHEKSGRVFVSSEWDGMICVFDFETGRWLGKTIGRRCAPVSGRPIGESVFSRSVEGLAILGDYLLAVDEGFDAPADGTEPIAPGRLLLFRLDDPALYQTDAESCRARMAAGRPAGLVGWCGNFLSPDGVAVFAGSAQRPDPLVAVADQHHYRVILYQGNDLIRALGSAAKEGSR